MGILNKKKPPPQILDLNKLVIESEEDFNVIMDKIPEYGVVDEEEEETLLQIEMLKKTMRQYRLRKKELYEEAKSPKTTDDITEDVNKSSAKLNLSCHERAHTEI